MLFVAACGIIKAPSASWGTVTWHTNRTRARLSGVAYLGWPGRGGMALGGIDPGVVLWPAVPGLAPWGL
jgi:hypothetical protein